MEERIYTFGHESSVAHYSNMEKYESRGMLGFKV